MTMKYIFSFSAALPSRFIMMALGVTLWLSACTPSEKQVRSGQKLKIVTTTGMIKDAADRIAGDKAEVIALMGPGVDPHLYKATQGDLSKLTDADLVFYNGLHLEGKMGEVLEKLGKTRPVIAVASNIPDSLLRKVPGFQGAYDPHIWFDVKLWQHAVRTVTKSLQQFDTANASWYEERSRRYLQQLDSLHGSVATSIQQIPEAQRVLITAHDAFGYFGDAYHIGVRGLQGISTVSEFGLKDVTGLVSFIISRRIKAIFIETSVSQRSIEAVVEGCHQRGWNVKIGGSLYSDAMGPAGTPQGTYIGMVSANVKTIVDALK
jgi:manganese/zinc/iron transport system substrate-binding protein